MRARGPFWRVDVMVDEGERMGGFSSFYFKGKKAGKERMREMWGSFFF